jgi:hypothetical protein
MPWMLDSSIIFVRSCWDACFLGHLRRIRRSARHWTAKRLHFGINKLTIRIDLKAIDQNRIVAYAEYQVVSYIWKSDDAESRDQKSFRFLTSSLHLIIQHIASLEQTWQNSSNINSRIELRALIRFNSIEHQSADRIWTFVRNPILRPDYLFLLSMTHYNQDKTDNVLLFLTLSKELKEQRYMYSRLFVSKFN